MAMPLQRAKKVVSDSPRLVDFAIGLVNFVLLVNASFSLPKWQAIKMIFLAPCFVYVQLVGTIQSFLMVDD